jgi:exodeoxyribonuclease V alpha subunit
MKILLGNEEKTVVRENYIDISLAYAMTIHKSQGSEYDNVIVALPSSAPNMLARNLLYTAVTRAKKHVTILGSEDAIRKAVYNVRNQERRTTLKELLCV